MWRWVRLLRGYGLSVLWQRRNGVRSGDGRLCVSGRCGDVRGRCDVMRRIFVTGWLRNGLVDEIFYFALVFFRER